MNTRGLALTVSFFLGSLVGGVAGLYLGLSLPTSQVARHLTPASLGLVVPSGRRVVDISHAWEEGSEDRLSVRANLGETVRIDLADGPWAVFQFTAVEGDRFQYRWRYRKSASSEILSGVGEVQERYEHIPRGSTVGVLPLPGHDTVIRAGEIRAEWSVAGARDPGCSADEARSTMVGAALYPTASFQ